MLLELERNCGLSMDALVIECSWNTNGNMVWARMLWSSSALGTRKEVWFGHGCSGHRVLLEHERNDGLGMDALVAVCLEHEQNAGLGMDALVIESFWNMNGIMVWAWMLWSPSALGTRTEFWFGHGCSGHRKLLEHERKYGWGMDALVIECSWNKNGVTVWARMLWSSSALGTRRELWFGHGCSGRHVLNARSAQRILRFQLQSPSFLDVLTIRLPRLCTPVWPTVALTREAAGLFKQVRPR